MLKIPQNVSAFCAEKVKGFKLFEKTQLGVFRDGDGFSISNSRSSANLCRAAGAFRLTIKKLLSGQLIYK